MAAGNILLQANDSKVANIVFEDGASGNMSVTVPKEGGTLANEAYVNTTAAPAVHTHTAANITDLAAAITAQKASSTVYGVAKISVSGSTLTITTT